MTYREFYIWLEGYLDGRLEDNHIGIAPIVEKMSKVVTDEQKLIDDFRKYKSLGISLSKQNPYDPPFDVTCEIAKNKK